VASAAGWEERLARRLYRHSQAGYSSAMHVLSIVRVNCALLGLLALPACMLPAAPAHAEAGGGAQLLPVNAVDKVVDDWHRAASLAEADLYLGLMAPEFRFLGTDGMERWDRESFTKFVDHYFRQEHRGWTYLPEKREVTLSADGKYAWFDELLQSATYGELRGSGVLILQPEGWRIAQYSMTFVVPNKAASVVRDYIRQAIDSTAEEEAVEGEAGGQ
jgi:hypothetical protein